MAVSWPGIFKMKTQYITRDEVLRKSASHFKIATFTNKRFKQFLKRFNEMTPNTIHFELDDENTGDDDFYEIWMFDDPKTKHLEILGDLAGRTLSRIFRNEAKNQVISINKNFEFALLDITGTNNETMLIIVVKLGFTRHGIEPKHKIENVKIQTRTRTTKYKPNPPEVQAQIDAALKAMKEAGKEEGYATKIRKKIF